ncbi:MAG: hypothetical protein ABI462_05420 [Ignavibacteria bacterium]
MKAIKKVIVKTKSKAIKKIISAILSYLEPSNSLLVRIDRKEKMLLAVKKIDAIPVSSSIIVISLYFEILSDVRTIRQNPSRLDEVFSMCADLFIGVLFFLSKNFNAV